MGFQKGNSRGRKVLIKAFLIRRLCQTQLFLIFLLGKVIFKKKKKKITRSGRKHPGPEGGWGLLRGQVGGAESQGGVVPAAAELESVPECEGHAHTAKHVYSFSI